MADRISSAAGEYAAALESLRSARMGTELIAPLLYSLVRSTRAQRVLEIGAGQTTLALLKGLDDNRRDIMRERAQLAAKQRGFDPDWLVDERAVERDQDDVVEWLAAEPALVDPRFFDRDYAPRCVSIDDVSSPFSRAPAVDAAAQRAGLNELLDLRLADFRDVADAEGIREPAFDLVWFDCGGHVEYRDFLSLYWDHVTPAGGMIVLHYTLTVPAHERVLADLERERREGRTGSFELLSILEPHKLMQNSCTLIRRCEAPAPRYAVTRPISLERSGW